MVDALLAGHWNTADVDILASGEDAGGQTLPSNAWMALRRLGWSVTTLDGIRVNDRIVRMAQETAGRTLRSAKWRADLTAAVLATWPADPSKRTPEEWDAVRSAAPGARHLPSSVIKGRTRQVAAFVREHGRLPVDVFEAEDVPDPLTCCCCRRVTGSRQPSNGTRVIRAGHCCGCNCRPGLIRSRTRTGHGCPARSRFRRRFRPRRCCTCPPCA
ncbi:hypothetical protein WKI68_20585 [Streptomyces sp. MS1.HAVA.3]|uniref:Uncharacterized protein n=1 Tax=Streptomyces caledonius TaxID=3134107 RepID=A0ABU8U6H9_9ACTN